MAGNVNQRRGSGVANGDGKVLGPRWYRHTTLVYPRQRDSGKRDDRSLLLPEDDAQAAPPVFRKPDPDNVELRRKHPQQAIGRGMES